MNYRGSGQAPVLGFSIYLPRGKGFCSSCFDETGFHLLMSILLLPVYIRPYSLVLGSTGHQLLQRPELLGAGNPSLAE